MTRGGGQFYACIHTPQTLQRLVGLWYCHWADIEQYLPHDFKQNKQLLIKGFDTRTEAVDYFIDKMGIEVVWRLG